VDGVVYWITSHACKPGKPAKDGKDAKPPKPKTERQLFFATRVGGSGNSTTLAPEGKVYLNLLKDMLGIAELRDFHFEESAKMSPKDGATDDPKSWGGLNIESLCAAHDGPALFIGFRNPLPVLADQPPGKAILLPLLNAAEIVKSGSTIPARFDKPIALNLHGLGFRDMVWWKGSYLIIGGDYRDRVEHPDAPSSKLFRWNGIGEPEMLPLDFDKMTPKGEPPFNPEALIVFPDERVLIVSDDGASQKDQVKSDVTKCFFRSVWLEDTP
jgi:hypothetical protein